MSPMFLLHVTGMLEAVLGWWWWRQQCLRNEQSLVTYSEDSQLIGFVIGRTHVSQTSSTTHVLHTHTHGSRFFFFKGLDCMRHNNFTPFPLTPVCDR